MIPTGSGKGTGERMGVGVAVQERRRNEETDVSKRGEVSTGGEGGEGGELRWIQSSPCRRLRENEKDRWLLLLESREVVEEGREERRSRREEERRKGRDIAGSMVGVRERGRRGSDVGPLNILFGVHSVLRTFRIRLKKKA